MDGQKYDALKIENQLCFPLYAASREVIRKYKPYLDEIGLTYTQYISMMVMWDRKEVNVKELGQCLFLDSGTLTPLRNLIVQITDEGMALRERALHIPAALASCVNLETEEAMELYRLLYKVLGGMERV